jgi:hypothetical protein
MWPMAQPMEKRRWRRTVPRTPLVLRWRSAGKSRYGMASNISVAGCYVLANEPGIADQLVFVELEGTGLPEFEARVRFVDPEVGMGVEFFGLSQETRAKLETWLRTSG